MSVESDYRIRGYSLSEGDPAVTLALGYDHDSGAYLNGAATFDRENGDPVLLGYQANAGYAVRLNSSLSLDAGIVRVWYTRRSSFNRDTHYTEAYVGVAARRVAARIYLSPDYFRPGQTTLYGEVEGVIHPAPKWRINGHVGLLTHLNEPRRYMPDEHYDWRVTLGRELGPFDLRTSLSGGGPGTDYYSRSRHSATALTFGASLSF